MRKASQDGGDSTSITSGLDTDFKRSGLGILKTKKTSIKRKVQSFSHESDDGVVEPLLQKDKEKTESVNQSAKFSLSKTKTESISEQGDEKDKLLSDSKTGVPSMTSVPGITDNQMFANGIKDNPIPKTFTSSAPIHNHMHTNVFGDYDEMKSFTAPKSQVLVEIDGLKHKSYSPSPLIFTTAKIHSDGKTKPMEPVQVTPVPILSTIEGSIVKAGLTNDKDVAGSLKQDNISSNISVRSELTEKQTSAKDRITPVSSSNVRDTFYADLQPSKVISFLEHNKEATKDTSTNKVNDNIRLKDDISIKSSLPLITCSTISETVKTTPCRDVKSSVSGSMPSSTIVSKHDYSSKPASAICSKDIAIPREIESDINKNIPTVATPGTQKPETTIKASTVSTNVVSAVTKKDGDIKNTNSSFGNKHLPRQKNAVKEDIKEQANLPTVTSIDQTISKNIVKGPKFSDPQIHSVKEKASFLQDKPNSSKVSNLAAKSTANNIASSVTMFPSANSAISSTANKSSTQSLTSITKLPVSISKSATAKSATPVSKPSMTNASTPTEKSLKLATTKPLMNVTTAVPTSKTSNTIKTITTTLNSAKVQSPVTSTSTKSTTNSKTDAAKVSSISTVKSPTATVMSPASITKSLPPKAISSKVTTVSTGSTTTASLTKTSDNASVKAITPKTSSTTKPSQLKLVTTAAGAATAKQSGSSSDCSKDDKSKA